MTKTDRTEHDFLGEKKIEKNCLYGIHTARALENFPISGRTVNHRLIKSLALVKKACLEINCDLGFIDKNLKPAILEAIDDVYSGKLNIFFVVDAMQGGAGTSTNMNLNEVIANRASKILGFEKHKIEAIEHVNKHQSTNDVYPTGLRLAVYFGLEELSIKISKLQGSLQKKEKEFADVLKIGRTEMQEAVPMTLGQEFAAFADAIARDRWRIFKSQERIRVINLGGTAIGTGFTAPREYIFKLTEKLRQLTEIPVSRAENLVDGTSNNDDFLEVFGMLDAHANNLIKIAQDLRLMNLLGEIKLPALQSGSSIIPGKINPVICEAVIQVGIKTFANGQILKDCFSRSTLQICEFMPLAADAMLETLDLLININELFSKYIDKITVDEKKCKEIFNNSLTLATAFLPHIGYEKIEKLLKKFQGLDNLDNVKNIKFKIFLKQELGKELVKKVLSPEALTSLGYKNE